MGTYADKFAADVAEVVRQVEALPSGEYSTDDVVEILVRTGTKLELYLKGVLFPSRSARKNLQSFISALQSCGVSRGEVEALQDLRDAYNLAKHNPNRPPSALETIELLRRAKPALDSVASICQGLSQDHWRAGHGRVYWIAAWDHYIGGDTEVHVMLPAPHVPGQFLPELDLVYIDISSWDEVLRTLAHVGTAGEGDDHIPATALHEFAAEDDFLAALAFEGDYRDLMVTLAQHERREDLLPSLRRQDSGSAMLQAVLLAGCDVAASADSTDEDRLREGIEARAVAVYAVPSDYSGLPRLSSGVAEMLCQMDPSGWSKLSGPRWVTADAFEAMKANALAVHRRYDVLVNSGSAVVIPCR